jgi:uncharacterized protein (TIGR02145 family)
MGQKSIITFFLLIVLLFSCRSRSGQNKSVEKEAHEQTVPVTSGNSDKSVTSTEIQPGEIITDVEGNEYPVIRIGNQSWFLKNLKTATLNDGTPIKLVTDSVSWSSLSSPGYCWYDNEMESFRPTYGALYNGYTANTGKLCPKNWHVPTVNDWRALTSLLGGESVAGGKMKGSGTSFWVGPNTGATNESGFNALPGGLRYHDGSFRDFGFSGYWWSSTLVTKDRAFFIYLDYEYANAFRFDNLLKIGFSVRCVRDY